MPEVYQRTDIYDLLEDEHRYNAIKKHWTTILEGKNIRSLLDEIGRAHV